MPVGVYIPNPKVSWCANFTLLVIILSFGDVWVLNLHLLLMIFWLSYNKKKCLAMFKLRKKFQKNKFDIKSVEQSIVSFTKRVYWIRLTLVKWPITLDVHKNNHFTPSTRSVFLPFFTFFYAFFNFWKWNLETNLCWRTIKSL